MGKAGMRPLDFVSVARQLGKNEDEASLRSAASRAYYGAFHFAGQRLEELTANHSNSFRWSGVRKNHDNLRAEWRLRWGPAGYLIASFLFDAHEMRKTADYELEVVFTPEDKAAAFGFVAQALLAVHRMR